MDINKLKFTRLQNRIVRLLCINAGTELSQREIADKLKVSPTAVSKALPLLKASELFKTKKSSRLKLNLIQLNRDSRITIEIKRTENLSQIYESGLSEYLEDNHPGCTIISFGSYSRGEDIHTSDIDIAIIGSKGKELDLKKFNKTLERQIMINHYKQFKEINNNLRNNILNGIVLSGTIEL